MDHDRWPEPSQWWPREQAAFSAACQEFLGLLEDALGPTYEIVDQSDTLTISDPSA